MELVDKMAALLRSMKSVQTTESRDCRPDNACEAIYVVVITPLIMLSKPILPKACCDGASSITI